MPRPSLGIAFSRPAGGASLVFLLIYNYAYLSAAVCMSGLSGLVEKWSPLWCVIQNFIISHGADVSSLRK
jgi:hypothetical protein